MRKHHIDLVNTHSSLDSWIGGIAARIGKRRLIRTRHLSTPIKPGLNSRILYKSLADFVVTTCASIVPMIAKQSGRPLNQCRSVATGVDPKQIHAKGSKSFRKNLGILPSDFLVGTACSMRSWKGIDDLLKAANLLRDDPHLKWVIIGGGHAERHKKLAAELKLDGIVIFTGHLDNPFPALASLDLFTLLSTAHEGVSQAILQAAFLKKPLLSTQIGGLGEVCIDQVTGINVAPFSAQEVAQGVRFIKEHPDEGKRFANNAHQLVLEKFTFDQTLDQMESICQALALKSANR
jgi:glycosyltransferase involved in cell wall biosynthesis